jgi:hypothetical protein
MVVSTRTQPLASPLGSNFYPGSVNITQGKIIADVLDDPSQMFLIQNDGTSTAADYGKNADIVVGTGSTTTGVSANELDTSTLLLLQHLTLRSLVFGTCLTTQSVLTRWL